MGLILCGLQAPEAFLLLWEVTLAPDHETFSFIE